MIRVIVCDDQVVVSDGLEFLLMSDPEIEVVGNVQDGSEAIDLIPETEPDLILMDLQMPGMNGVQATREITKMYPEIKVLVLTTFGTDEWVFDAIRSGASGYLLKGTSRAELIKAVKGTAAGSTHVDPDIAGKLFSQVAQSTTQTETLVAADLSERELDILKLLARGRTNSEIAERLYLTQGTVRNYVSSILAKLEVEDRTQAAILAVKHGLVE